MLTLDGSRYEGGGQMLRTAMALSCLTGKDFRMMNIRAGRNKPGLKMQHVTAGKLLMKLCDAKCAGFFEGSMEIEFFPGKPVGGVVAVDIGTAGSVTLLLQSVLLPCCFAEKRTILRITGGTDVAWSMSNDYFAHVVLPYYRQYADIEYSVERRGFYPVGGGQVSIKIVPKHGLHEFGSVDALRAHLQPLLVVERGRLFSIKLMASASSDLAAHKVAEQQAEAARIRLVSKSTVDVRHSYGPTDCPGSVLFGMALFSAAADEPREPVRTGVDVLGDGLHPEEVGKKVAELLLGVIDSGTLDPHIGDNLVPLVGLAGGQVRCPVTSHAKANAHVCEQFLGGKFDLSDGIAYEAPTGSVDEA